MGALVTGVQTCSLPISLTWAFRKAKWFASVPRHAAPRQSASAHRLMVLPKRASGPTIPPSFSAPTQPKAPLRSEEHTSELQSLMRISYAVFCLKKKKIKQNNRTHRKQNIKWTEHSYISKTEE